MRSRFLAFAPILLVANAASAEPQGQASSQVTNTERAIATSLGFARVGEASFRDEGAQSRTVLRRRQYFQGVPIERADLLIQRDGLVSRTATELQTNTRALVSEAQLAPLRQSLQALWTGTQLTNAGVARIRAEERRSQLSMPHGDLVITRAFDGMLHLAVRVTGITKKHGKLSIPAHYIDAESGDSLYQLETIRFLNKADVYASNSVTSTRMLRDLPMATDDPAEGERRILKNARLDTRNCIDEGKVKNIRIGGSTVSSRYCETKTLAFANGEGDFVFSPVTEPSMGDVNSDPFSEVSMFYHTARAYQFFRDAAADPNANVVRGDFFSTRANVRLPSGLEEQDFQRIADPTLPLEPLQNAFFSPASGFNFIGALFDVPGGGIYFGQSERTDYAYDGDVIYHEFTHAVVDATINLEQVTFDEYGISYAPGAMNEALADYFAAAISGDPNIGEYASGDLPGSGSAIRSIDNKKTCDETVIGQVHNDSEFFSGALWETRMGLPEAERNGFDGALYRAMLAGSNLEQANYDELAKHFVSFLKGSLAAASDALKQAFERRGVLPVCKRIVQLKARERARGSGYFQAPGTEMVRTKEMPGVVQFHYTLPEGAKQLTIEASADAERGGDPAKFLPFLSIKYGEPLTWRYEKQSFVSNAETQVSIADGTVKLDLPENTREVYIQLVNRGRTDGYYRSVRAFSDLDPEPPPPPPPPATTASTPKPLKTAPPPEPSAPAAEPVPGASAVAGGGCSCRATSDATNARDGWLPILGAAFALAYLRRRGQGVRAAKDAGCKHADQQDQQNRHV
jgi:MYXO-CTERM domain-containing protein